MKTEEKALKTMKPNIFIKTINFFKKFFIKRTLREEKSKEDEVEKILNSEDVIHKLERNQFEETMQVVNKINQYEVLFEKLLAGEINSKDLSDFEIMKVTEVCEKRTIEINREIAEKKDRLNEVEKRINNYASE